MTNNFFYRKKRGFSLIELLVAIAIILILAATSVGGYFYFKKDMSLSIAIEQVVYAIRKTQNKATYISSDDSWGINIQNNQAVIFKGTTFSGRNLIYDETIKFSGITNLTGVTQIVFSKFEGIPSANGIITLSNGNNSKNIQINEKGIINY